MSSEAALTAVPNRLRAPRGRARLHRIAIALSPVPTAGPRPAPDLKGAR